MAAITAYNISLWLHITAVVVGFGATFAGAVMFPLAMRLGAVHLPFAHRLMLAINQRLATPALVVVLITGIYQAADGDWDFGAFWISATFVIVIVLGGLIGAFFIPSDRRLAEMAEREGGEPSAEYQRQAQRAGQVGGLAGLLIVVAIFLMVTKLGA